MRFEAGILTGIILLISGGVNATPIYSVTDLGTLGGAYSGATGINNSGQVVGYSATAGNARRSFLYSNGFMADLGTLGGTNSYGAHINNQGQVAGHAEVTGNYPTHAFLYSNGGMSDLGTWGGLLTLIAMLVVSTI